MERALSQALVLGRMSEVLELVLNLIGGLLEMVLDGCLGDFPASDTTASRIFWAVILVFLGTLIGWELS